MTAAALLSVATPYARVKLSPRSRQRDRWTTPRNGQTIKEFRAICPVTKFVATRVYARVTAANARRFLLAQFEVAWQALRHPATRPPPNASLACQIPNEYPVVLEAAWSVKCQIW